MPLYSVQDAKELICETLMRCKTSETNAGLVADALIAAELSGQAGHGMRRVPSYAAQALSGKVDGNAQAKADKTAAATLRIDAANGFAYPALALAEDVLPEMAKVCGIAIAAIHRSHHCGVAGVVVEKFAERGLVAMLFANTPAAMAPWGGDRAVFGTNPIAFAAPREDAIPIVVDVSLSKVARGKIMAAKQKGIALEEGWALDADGNPTVDPAEALNGTMVPLGDAKGTALALMVELLAAGITGANYAASATSFFDGEGTPPGVGQTIIVIDPSKTGGTAVISHIEELASEIEAQSGARLPGARRHSIKEELLVGGIEIDDELLALITQIGR